MYRLRQRRISRSDLASARAAGDDVGLGVGVGAPGGLIFGLIRLRSFTLFVYVHRHSNQCGRFKPRTCALFWRTIIQTLKIGRLSTVRPRLWHHSPAGRLF
jgi:hypothetical protein